MDSHPPTLTYDFAAGVGYWICQTAHAIERQMNERLGDQGITFQQWQVLAWLVLEGHGLSQAELAERMRIECPTLAGILERMERNGWVLRTTDPKDRRKKIVQPAEQVREVWQKMVDTAHDLRAQTTAGIPADELALTIRTLKKILGNLGAAIPFLEEDGDRPEGRRTVRASSD